MSTNHKKFLLRLPQDAYTSLMREAEKACLSLNQLIVQKVSDKMTTSESNSLVDSILNANLVVGWREKILGILLFGSAARNQLGTNSDIDLLVVLSKEIHINRDLYRQCDKVFGELSFQGYPVSIHFVHPPEDGYGSLWLEVSLEGIVLYDTDRWLTSQLIKIRSSIATGHVTRKIIHGLPYWVDTL